MTQTQKNLILGLAFLVALSVMVYNVADDWGELKADNETTIGLITHIGYNHAGSSGAAEYEYFVNGKRYVGQFARQKFCSSLLEQGKESILGGEIVVVYVPSNPSNSMALLEQDDFEQFHTELTDSMKNFLNRYFTCE